MLILNGPFVDATHPKLANGNVEMENEDGGVECVDYDSFFNLKVQRADVCYIWRTTDGSFIFPHTIFPPPVHTTADIRAPGGSVR